tara:strand:- start:230 stop:457 length:228 start_codon:yes stop_codon:yes gene_type:complete
MSTTFGVQVGDELMPVARRNGIGAGRVGITFTNPLARLLPSDTQVVPMDNTAQGVEMIGDLLYLETHGMFQDIEK